jgi:hypothetical protein
MSQIQVLPNLSMMQKMQKKLTEIHVSSDSLSYRVMDEGTRNKNTSKDDIYGWVSS